MENENHEALHEITSNLVAAVDKLADRVEYTTKAVRYLADCYGFAGDKVNPGEVKLKEDAEIPRDTPIVKKVKPYTFDQIKAIMNAYAKKHGKDAALKLVKKYAESMDLKDVKESDYTDLAREAE